jgi:hypothetical protein
VAVEIVEIRAADNSIEKPGFALKPPHIRKFCRNPEKKLTRNPFTALTLGERSPKVGGAQFAIRLRN